jgi:hypothetical protein
MDMFEKSMVERHGHYRLSTTTALDMCNIAYIRNARLVATALCALSINVD